MKTTITINGYKFNKNAGFVCIGNVRGWCGHIHKTAQAAQACCDRDECGCNKQGGYSDRVIFNLADGKVAVDC